MSTRSKNNNCTIPNQSHFSTNVNLLTSKLKSTDQGENKNAVSKSRSLERFKLEDNDYPVSREKIQQLRTCTNDVNSTGNEKFAISTTNVVIRNSWKKFLKYEAFIWESSTHHTDASLLTGRIKMKRRFSSYFHQMSFIVWNAKCQWSATSVLEQW